MSSLGHMPASKARHGWGVAPCESQEVGRSHPLKETKKKGLWTFGSGKRTGGYHISPYPGGSVITHSYLQTSLQRPGHQGQAPNSFKTQGCFSAMSQALCWLDTTVKTESEQLISSPPAKANRKPFRPVLGCLSAPQGGWRRREELWPRGNSLELMASGLVR